MLKIIAYTLYVYNKHKQSKVLESNTQDLINLNCNMPSPSAPFTAIVLIKCHQKFAKMNSESHIDMLLNDITASNVVES